jgi:hypothetical protein
MELFLPTFEIDPMFFKLLKELPQMFIIAAIIWFFVLVVFFKNNRKQNLGFFYKHKSTFTSIIAAIVLTMADIWLFVSYIPTHFKKVSTESNALPSFELLDSSFADHKNVKLTDTLKKDSTKQSKTVVVAPVEMILLTRQASIRFYSQGSAEDIEATNSTVACSFNETTGQLKFTGLIRGFVFENGMMQEHFNDPDYMNSAAFPKTSFTGTIQNIKSIDFTKDGNTKVTAEGSLSIHGVSKNITAPGTLVIAAGKPTLKSVFKIKRVDFGINTDEIAEELEITVISNFK